MDWLTDSKIPVGKWSKAVVDWLIDNAAWFFDGLANILDAMIAGFLWVLQTPHPFVVVAVFAGLAWYLRRSWAVVAFTVA